MSASRRPTRRPCICRARARLAATVDLPTPPLPLATATRCLIVGRETLGICCPPGGCMKVVLSESVAAAQLAEVFQGVQAGVVAVAPGDLVGVIADRGHAQRLERRQLTRLEDAERVGRLVALLATAGTGTVLAQLLPGIFARLAVAPDDDQKFVAFLAQGRRADGLRRWTGHD